MRQTNIYSGMGDLRNGENGHPTFDVMFLFFLSGHGTRQSRKFYIQKNEIASDTTTENTIIHDFTLYISVATKFRVVIVNKEN